MSAEVQDGWDRFELKILRLCRGQYLILASLGAAAVVACGVAALVGVGLGAPSEPKLPDEIPALQPLSLAAVEGMESKRPDLFDLAKIQEKSLSVENYQIAKTTVPSKKRELFPDSSYAWDDVAQEFCRSPSDFGCLEKGRRISKIGLHRVLTAVRGDSSNDDAEIIWNGIQPTLAQASVEKRARLILPSAVAYIDAAQAHQKEVERRQKVVDELTEKHVVEVSERTTLKAMLIGGGLYGIGAGFSAMLLAGLFLAFLAAERHLRAIRETQPAVESTVRHGLDPQS